MGNGGTHLTTWVARETKDRFSAVARHQGLSDSALLKRLIDLVLQSANVTSGPVAVGAAEVASRASRVTVRLRPDDQFLLRERASARGVAPATYVSVLVRSHLRALAPLPKEELIALRKTVSELGSIGRNLNQIARGGQPGGARERSGPRGLKGDAAGLRGPEEPREGTAVRESALLGAGLWRIGS